MPLPEDLRAAADKAEERQTILDRMEARDDKLAAAIQKLRDDSEQESADDRKELSRLDAEIAKLVGPAIGSEPSKGRRRRSTPSSVSGRPTADHGKVYDALKKLGEANAKTIADEIGEDTVPVSNALSDMNKQSRVAAAGRGRFPKYRVID